MGSYDHVRDCMDLTPHEFELFIADVWQERQGWNTEVSDEGSDSGIDVYGQHPEGGGTTVVQCKRYAPGNKVTSSQIQQYGALRQQFEPVSGVTVVTTSEFTSSAEETAERLDVKLFDGTDLNRLIERYSAREILDWYLEGRPED